MSEPKIELIPMRASVRSDAETILDVMIRITPPLPEIHFVRPKINLGLVLDRSGSMEGAKKLEYAREAGAFAVQQLQPGDRVGVTIFDDRVETIVPSGPASNRQAVIERIRGIRARGSTNLHGGWKEGCEQVSSDLTLEGMNRVILLSDGLANQGVTDPNAIAGEVKSYAGKGVSTTTMGLGNDYNEDLMQLMAESGDGNYYYIESPVQLADIFQTEMQGLMANLGQKVSLGADPRAGVKVVEILNDLTPMPNGRWMLPNLIVGMATTVLVRLKVPPLPRESALCEFRIAWDNPKTDDRTVRRATLTLASCLSSAWDTLTDDPAVAEEVAILMAARAKREAIVAYDRGDFSGTMASLGAARGHMSTLPCSPAMSREMDQLSEIEADLAAGQGGKFRKKTMWQAWQKKRGKES